MRITMLLFYLLCAFAAKAQDTDWKDVEAVHQHYVGCLDGITSLRMSSGEQQAAALAYAEESCKDQFDVVRGSVQRLFEDQLGIEEYKAHKNEVDPKIEELVAGAKDKARRAVRRLIQQRNEGKATLRTVQDAADAALKAAEEAAGESARQLQN